MNVILTTIGKNHSFELARQLHRHHILEGIYTGYPRYKLKNEKLPPEKIHTFPWLQTLYMARGKFGVDSYSLERELAWWSNNTLDRYVSARISVCDIFMALSNTGLHTGRKVQKRGGRYICDRGCSHIRYQDNLLREEYALRKTPFPGLDPRTMAREEAEYAAADAITVPSLFAKNSFLAMGIPEEKLHLISYGVELSRFHPVAAPDPSEFNVLFVGNASIRKGVIYLLEAFACLQHPRKRLQFVGSISQEMQRVIDGYAEKLPIECVGHCRQTELKELMSRSHVKVLPSIEDGFGMVMAEAMACGCPVIATTNTGARDLYEDEKQGYIINVRDVQALTGRMQQLADDPVLQKRMSEAARQKIQSKCGWNTYGDMMYQLFSSLLKARS